MRRRDSRAPAAWLGLAEADLRTAEVLIEADETTYVGFHLHQAVEKGLKAFLLSKGASAPRIHDLDELLDAAVGLRAPLEPFKDLCMRISHFHTTHRYPGEAPDRLAPEELEALRDEVRNLLAAIEAAVGPG